MKDFTIKEVPFSWNDNFSEVALEDFSNIQKSLPYCTCQTIGMALAKLELLEKQGAKVEEEKLKESRADGVKIFYDNLLMGLDKTKRLMIADGYPEKDADEWYRMESGWIKAAYEFTKNNIEAGID